MTAYLYVYAERFVVGPIVIQAQMGERYEHMVIPPIRLDVDFYLDYYFLKLAAVLGCWDLCDLTDGFDRLSLIQLKKPSWPDAELKAVRTKLHRIARQRYEGWCKAHPAYKKYGMQTQWTKKHLTTVLSNHADFTYYRSGSLAELPCVLLEKIDRFPELSVFRRLTRRPPAWWVCLFGSAPFVCRKRASARRLWTSSIVEKIVEGDKSIYKDRKRVRLSPKQILSPLETKELK